MFNNQLKQDLIIISTVGLSTDQGLSLGLQDNPQNYILIGIMPLILIAPVVSLKLNIFTGQLKFGPAKALTPFWKMLL